MPRRFAFLVASVAAVAGVASPAADNEDHQLNRVWSRMADLTGEFGSVESAEFSPDSRFIATGTKYDNTVRVFRTADEVLQWTTELPAEIERVAWTGDGRRVVTGSEDKTVRVIDAEDGAVLKEIAVGSGIDGLELSPGGRLMAVGLEKADEAAGDRSDKPVPVILYDTRTWEEVRRLDQRATANEIAFFPDGRRTVVAGGRRMRVWEVETGELLGEAEPFTDSENPNNSRFICAKVAPDGRHIAVGANGGWVYLFDADGRYIRRVNKTGDKIETVEWTKDGRYVLSAGKGNVIDFIAAEHALDTRLSNNSVPIAMRIEVTDQIESMHFNASGALLTTAHQDGTVQLWTCMSDNPAINQRSHRRLIRQQIDEFGG